MKWSSVIFSGLLLCACSAGGEGLAKSVTLSGKLVLMGNEPFVYPSVQLANGQSWELGGVSRQRAEGLQNRTVEVSGKVVRPAGVDPKGPKLEVIKLEVRN